MPKIIRNIYSEAFKLEVLRDYYSNDLSINATAKKWGIHSFSGIRKWKKSYPIDSELLSLPAELIEKLKMEQTPQSREKLLEEELLRVKKALELEKLRSYAFMKMIEITEKEEGISILKKDGVK